LESLNGGRALDLKTMNCDRIGTIFDAASVMKQRQVSDYQMASGRRQSDKGAPRIQTIEDLNSANAKFWDDRSGRRNAN
jgi:hypothetical protein